MKIFKLNPFTEKEYLLDKNENSSKISDFYQKVHFCYVKRFNEDTMNNTELIVLYYLFLIKTRELIDFLNISNDDYLKSIVVEYLIFNGYLSLNDKFSVNDKTKEIGSFPGINIILGNGVCRNIAGFYEDLFKDFYDYPLTYYCYCTKIKNNPLAKYLFSNHAINLAYYHDTLYGNDLLNKTTFTFNDAFSMNPISTKNQYYLRYKPNYDFIKHYDVNFDFNRLLDLFRSNVVKKPLTKEEINTIRNKIYRILDERKKILLSFSEDTNKLKSDIKEKMLSKK